ncbi:dextrin dextranase [Malassezia equina]|uniref:Mannosyltransferase n=1 Tax=Malassezia equina TaxID=1381935 RepID=A0AAF0EDF4_9BASI|nr:dextrin dextranase [Malassezia equina]
MAVADCDEVYNYWEPVHLLAGPNSKEKAFQTWEYAPQYAIRSWAYIALHAWVPALMTLAQLPPYAGFFALRLTLAAVSSLCDAFLYDAVARYINVRTARYTLVFLAGCAGMISASSARWLVAVLAAALVAVPILLVDSLAYGRVVLVPLNTLLYNVLGRASGIGPELYGVEPPSYYLVSLLLAFSVVVPLALMALPTVIASAKFLPQRFSQGKGSHSAWLLGLRVLPVYLWVAVLIVQPHKEERFMYPIYPLLCVNAAVCLYLLRAATETVYLRLTRSPYRASHTVLFSALTLAPLLLAVVLGAMRTLALIHHYRAPLDLGMVLSHMEGEHHLCYGKEWHRFPSHFFVPPSMRVDFVESEFDGILPHHFARTEMSIPTPAP